jgi:phytoene synthase
VVNGDRRGRAYAYCERVARSHYENFPVASLLLPAKMRPHVAAIYAFARRADDFADEPGIADAERIRLLDDWSSRLHRAELGSSGARGSGARELGPRELGSSELGARALEVRELGSSEDELIFEALHATIRQFALPLSLFEDLLSAFRQDVTTHRYQTWDDVLDYCRRSANPVGRLVLRVAGIQNPRLDAASDAVCTALQLTNFWQDLGRDWTSGRLYVPIADMIDAGAREDDLQARRMTPMWRAVLTTMIERTGALFDAGRELCDGVSGRLKWELRLTWLGGRRILEKVETARLTSFETRPTLGAADAPALLRDAILWSRV